MKIIFLMLCCISIAACSANQAAKDSNNNATSCGSCISCSGGADCKAHKECTCGSKEKSGSDCPMHSGEKKGCGQH